MRFDEQSLPDSVTLLVSILLFMLLEDFSFHLSHRLLDSRRLYPLIHKVHHEYTVTVSISAEYAHLLEFAFGSMLPTAIGPIILGTHMNYSTLLVWTAVRMLETVDGHSGFEFSWSPFRLLPFSTSASYHNYHHSHNIGNYSSMFSLWDTIFGSNSSYFLYES
jgi:sterol desaturase/sphingolipid hydroxylase (fatty acid hydroxylase superfamily)